MSSTATTTAHHETQGSQAAQPTARHAAASGATSTVPPNRTGGWISVAGALVMVSGAVCHTAFGADLFTAMESEDRVEVANALTDVAGHHTALTVGTWLWILGACAMCLGGTLIVRSTSNQLASVARWAFAAAAGAVIVFFSAMVAIVERLAPSHTRGEDVITLVQVVGKGAATADWIATVLILGVGYAAVVFSGRATWAPRWLQGLAGTSLVVGMITLVLYAAETTLLTGLEVVIGIGTVIATGIVVGRRGI